MKRPKAYGNLVNKLPINKKKKFWLLRYWKGILGGLTMYLIIGFGFTILKSNSHYDYFINQDDVFEKNGHSYWENRCIEANNNPSNKGNPWCWDNQGNFHVTPPSKQDWYFDFMWGKYGGNMIFTLVSWPVHFIGYNTIDFRGISIVGG